MRTEHFYSNNEIVTCIRVRTLYDSADHRLRTAGLD